MESTQNWSTPIEHFERFDVGEIAIVSNYEVVKFQHTESIITSKSFTVLIIDLIAKGDRLMFFWCKLNDLHLETRSLVCWSYTSADHN